jgi:hypothetical protein
MTVGPGGLEWSESVDSRNAPVFIMSSERTGSNLLRTLLSNHSNISAPTAPHFLLFLHHLIPFYGPLEVERNARALFDDMLAIVNHRNYQWDLAPDFDKVFEKYKPQTFLGYFDLFYREDAARKGKGRFACKENNLFDYAFHLADHYDSAKYVYLCRDPRDYVASFMRVPFGFDTPYDAARNWLREQEKCISLIETFGLEALRIRYEDLVGQTAEVMTDLLSFLGEPVEEACFNVDTEKSTHLDWNVYWRNLSKPVLRSNAGKFRSQFDQKTVNMIETMTREFMVKLEYGFDSPADWKRPRFFRYWHAIARQVARARSRRRHSETAQVLEDRRALVDSIAAKRKQEWLRRQEPAA